MRIKLFEQFNDNHDQNIDYAVTDRKVKNEYISGHPLDDLVKINNKNIQVDKFGYTDFHKQEGASHFQLSFKRENFNTYYINTKFSNKRATCETNIKPTSISGSSKLIEWMWRAMEYCQVPQNEIVEMIKSVRKKFSEHVNGD